MWLLVMSTLAHRTCVESPGPRFHLTFFGLGCLPFDCRIRHVSLTEIRVPKEAIVFVGFFLGAELRFGRWLQTTTIFGNHVSDGLESLVCSPTTHVGCLENSSTRAANQFVGSSESAYAVQPFQYCLEARGDIGIQFIDFLGALQVQHEPADVLTRLELLRRLRDEFSSLQIRSFLAYAPQLLVASVSPLLDALVPDPRGPALLRPPSA